MLKYFYLRQVRKILLALTYVLFGSDTFSQPFIDVLNVQYAQTSISKLYKGKDEFKVNHEWKSYMFNAPLKLNDKKLLLISPDINSKQYQQSDSTLTTQQNGSTTIIAYSRFHEHYISYALPVTLILNLKNQQSISATLIYRQNKVYKNSFAWSSDQLGGAVLYTKTYSNKFKLRGGIYYNREFWGNNILPLLGFEWKASKNIYCWGVLPTSANIDVSFNKVHAGFAFRGIEESYSEGYSSYFRDREGHLKLYLNYYLIKKNQKIGVVLLAEGGQSVNRLYQFKASNNDNISKYHPAENTFIRIGVAVRLMTNSDFKLWPSYPI